jgi:hypothetical protein
MISQQHKEMGGVLLDLGRTWLSCLDIPLCPMSLKFCLTSPGLAQFCPNAQGRLWGEVEVHASHQQAAIAVVASGFSSSESVSFVLRTAVVGNEGQSQI